jgi:hypothetical protein
MTASRQGGDNAAALACRHRKAAELPRFTPGQWMPTSEWQAARMAAIWGDGGRLLSPGGAPGGGGAVGSAVAAEGSLAPGASGGGGAGVCGDAAAAGGGADFAGAGAGAALSAGRGPTASSAVLQDGETLAALRLRHSSASRVPGVTPAHCAMKSERQDARIAEICSDDGCWAAANELPATSPVAIKTRIARQ